MKKVLLLPSKISKSLIYIATTMKKLTSIFTLALIAIMSFSLTSCDEDQQIALELDGTWRGEVQSNKGPFYVDIRFYQSGFSTHGSGYEYDEPVYGYGGDYARFSWSVNDGFIYLDYNDGSHVVIADYSLRNGQLSGYLQNARNGWDLGHIHLVKMPNNRYDDDYYAKQQQQIIDDSK